MDKVLKIIIELEGIIGAITGVIATLLVSELLKSKGKLHVYFQNWKLNFYKFENGVSKEVNSNNVSEKIDYSNFSFVFDLYNSSNTPKALRNVKLKFYKNKNNLLTETELKDETTSRFAAGSFRYDTIEVINIDPHKMMNLKICGVLDKNQSNLCLDYKYVYFEALNYKNKKIKQLIYKKNN